MIDQSFERPSETAIKRIRPSRVITVCAVGFLGLDALLLALAGVWSNSPSLMIWAALFALSAVGVVFSWRRHQRRIQEINQALAAREMEFMAMQREIERQRKT